MRDGDGCRVAVRGLGARAQALGGGLRRWCGGFGCGGRGKGVVPPGDCALEKAGENNSALSEEEEVEPHWLFWC